ncbi:YitT family protein [Sporosarcina sp. ACRSM]|uniref:YczE/YyaS/YitT family protein n=1 Tax=Sporosarcina sp. ACRSM TaxID=2918216 RepID=UPI001EF63DBA|nr:YitT family protein [Sporosarcina sp. ACRSM]MCG7335089.1 YitT family protein [Sporosarcina sp. ACRSM]
MRKVLLWRWAFYLVGMLVLSLGISMTIKGQRLGIGPWDVLHVGLFQHFGLSIGTWSVLTGCIIVTSTAVVLREWPKIGTWLNMVLVGAFIDLFNWMIPDMTAIWAQMIIFAGGIIVQGIGVGIYICPNIGAGPRDSLMLVLVQKTGASVKKIRTTIEVCVAIIGWIFGGPIGFGTALIALFLGQVVHYTLPQCRKLLLKIIHEENENLLY